jgi:hypothetical protein
MFRHGVFGLLMDNLHLQAAREWHFRAHNSLIAAIEARTVHLRDSASPLMVVHRLVARGLSEACLFSGMAIVRFVHPWPFHIPSF